jgi:hypothetical protein
MNFDLCDREEGCTKRGCLPHDPSQDGQGSRWLEPCTASLLHDVDDRGFTNPAVPPLRHLEQALH